MNPPGNAQRPLYGSCPRSIRSTFFLSTLVITTQSAVTAGLGYLYVYSIFVSFSNISLKLGTKVT